jgi:CheY-like chemotaxis protein
MAQGGTQGGASDILVVDDEADIRESVAELLEAAGYAVRTCCNGREAIEAIEHARPALVILDLMMPVMSGWEFVEWVKRYGLVAIDQVVVTSAVGVRCPTALLQVRKPFDAHELLAAIRKATTKDDDDAADRESRH